MSIALAIFYVALTSQILLISVYLPRIYIKRLRYVAEHFPPELYPKLYPGEFEYLTPQRRTSAIRRFGLLNTCIAFIGLAIVAYLLARGFELSPLGGGELYVALYFLLQVTPFLFAELSELRLFRLMRSSDTRTERSASLTPRHLRDFVPHGLLVLVAISYLVWFGLYLYLKTHSDVIGGGYDWAFFTTVICITAFDLAILHRVSLYLSGKRLDPYQAHADQMTQISVVGNTSFLAIFSVHLFMILSMLLKVFDSQIFDPVLTSLYAQASALVGLELFFKSRPIESIDFEVYRQPTT